jgi:hypothetical protein
MREARLVPKGAIRIKVRKKQGVISPGDIAEVGRSGASFPKAGRCIDIIY